MEYKTTKEEEFNNIYKTYADTVYRVSLYMTRDEERARDVTIKTFVALYKNLEEVPEERVRAFLVCVAKDFAQNGEVENASEEKEGLDDWRELETCDGSVADGPGSGLYYGGNQQ